LTEAPSTTANLPYRYGLSTLLVRPGENASFGSCLTVRHPCRGSWPWSSITTNAHLSNRPYQTENEP